MAFLSTEELEAAVDDLRGAPRERGTVELIVCRPAVGERSILDEAALDPEAGLTGDNWRRRPSRSTPDGKADPAKQITVINDRLARLLAGGEDGREEAGDQLYVDFDISVDHLPAGTRVQVGEAVIEISEAPHTGCAKFSSRFGPDAMRFVNSPVGRELRLRGLNARVVVPGPIRRGDAVVKL
jgi:hypothetical protein